MLNKIIIQGRLTASPELKTTPDGTTVTRFTLAVERDFKDKATGEKITDFIDCVAWRNTAEFVSRFFSKGRMASVAGRLQVRNWTDNDGNKRRNAEVVAENVYFCDSNNSGTGTTDGGQQPVYTETAPEYEELGDGEELPF